jgi:hypothetical protein
VGTAAIEIRRRPYVLPQPQHHVDVYQQGVRWWKMKGRISAEVNNILNQYYDVVLNYPMPGRNYKLILKVEV